jgi:hypothetical protein
MAQRDTYRAAKECRLLREEWKSRSLITEHAACLLDVPEIVEVIEGEHFTGQSN